MSDWLLSIAGTPAGAELATWLALSAAFLHALFGALQKGRFDPWTARTSIDIWILILVTPVALFLVPWPQGALWLALLGAVVIHTIYKVGQAMAYARGAYTVVYPVVRGTGPLFAVLGAAVFFSEHFSALQWAGLGVLLAGLFGLAGYNMATAPGGARGLGPALAWAVGTGIMVAVYTTYDAWGIRLAENPFTFLAWFFLFTSIDFPLLWLWRRRIGLAAPLVPAMGRGLLGALVAFGSFGAVMLATRLDKVGEAAVLRETSTVFAALIGWLVLKEPVGPRRAALMILIAAGAVIVELGGR